MPKTLSLHIPPGAVWLREGVFERRVARKQFVGAFAAQRDAETVLVDTLGKQIGVEAWANHCRFECLHRVDDCVDKRKRCEAVRFNRHLAKIEAGLIGIMLGINVISRIAPDGNVSWHGGAEAARIMRDQRAVDAAAK